MLNISPAQQDGATVEADPAAIVAAVEARARRMETRCGSGTMTWRVWGQGPGLLLLHGSHGSWTHWLRTIDGLAARWTLWVPDLPGCGDSADLSHAEHDALAAVIAAGLRQLAGAAVPVDLIGFSFGGVAAAHLAARHPDLVRRLVIVGSGGLDTPLGDIRLQKIRGLDGAAREAATRANLLGLMLHHAESADALAIHLQEANVSRARLDPRALVLPDRLLEALPHVRAPVSAIWGAHDRPHPANWGQEEALRRIRPELVFSVVAGAGHWVMYERPDDFCRLALELLGRS